MDNKSAVFPVVRSAFATEQRSESGSEINFEALFHAVPSPSLVISPQFTIVAANTAYLAVAGRTNADIIGINIFDAFPDNPSDPKADGVANLRASLLRTLATGRVDKMAVQQYDVAADVSNATFLPRYWKAVNTPVFGATGKISCVIHSVEEVTAAYVTQGKSLRDILANLNDSIRDLKTAEDIGFNAVSLLGTALGVSRAGYGMVDHANCTLNLLRDWSLEGIGSFPDFTNLGRCGGIGDDLKLDRVVAISDVAEDPRTVAEAAMLRARSAAAFIAVPVLDDGVLSAVLYVTTARPREWTVEEIILIKEVAVRIRMASERARSIAALYASEAKFRTIADAMPQMVWSTLPDGYHDYYNEQWYSFTGVPRDSTDGDGWNGIFHPDDQERAWSTWRASLKTGKTYEIEYRLRHHSGSYRWVLGRALPIRDDTGRIIRWMGTCTDIDNQKRAEDEWRRTSQRKDEFLAMLAHELRNPLAPIMTAAHLLALGYNDAQRVQKSSEVIMRQARHLTNLVDDLLDVSRVTRGLVELKRSDLDFKELLKNAIEQARPLIEQRHHQLIVELTPECLWVSGDSTRLIQVVVNLLNNAAKYTPQGGSITLTLQTEENEAHIIVTDNGSGIAPSLLPYVFDLFVQAERTPDRSQGGLGLGLTLVKRIMALHGGSVHASSEGLGRGSSFIVIIPRVQTASAY
jgi:PAS domain S-box-containing protein